MTDQSSPYRSDPNTVPLEEYKRLQKEIENQNAVIKRQSLARYFLSKWLPFSLVSVGVLFLLWFFLVRGEALGVNARANAEREALNFAKNHYGITVATAYCQNHGICSVRVPGRSRYIQLRCDTDYPVTNDGCYRIDINNDPPAAQIHQVRIVGPHGETMTIIDDAGSGSSN